MIKLLRQRRSIRQFTDRLVEKEKIKILQEALLRSPSSRNLNPWEFIFVTDKTLFEKLSVAKPHGASFVKNAVLAVVILGDTQKSDVWVEDCSIASILLQLTAQSIGLGSCWIQIRNRSHDDRHSASSYIQTCLNIPAHLQIESIIAIGYADEKKSGIPLEQLDDSKIFHNAYGNNTPF